MKLKMAYTPRITFILILVVMLLPACSQRVTTLGKSAKLEIREAADNGIRITLKPIEVKEEFPYNPALAEREYPDAVISINYLRKVISKQVGKFTVQVSPDPLKVILLNAGGRKIQELTFLDDGRVSFLVDEKPILGMGEGGPRMGKDWRNETIEFDRRGHFHEMTPRWQSNAYGSRNPVAFLLGTSGWGLYMPTPWVQIDLSDKNIGYFIPWEPPVKPNNDSTAQIRAAERMMQGRPPVDQIKPGVYDLFVFDATEPAKIMKDISIISGPAVLPPKYAMGYMQSHRTLENETQMLDIVKTFREKKIPIDAVIYLGSGFCPRGWNTPQPSFEFNPEVFVRDPAMVINDLHELNVKVIAHIVPWDRDKLPTLHGSIPPGEGEVVDQSHLLSYWNQHVDLVNAGIDAWWPDEGDWFNLYERINRHQLYYEGPLYSQPDKRPWSLHRNGHLGVAKWGGWVWSGDTESSWKTLEGQIAVGINHSLSLSPFWGSDIGGFYPRNDRTGEMYARWFQFGAFCPSFRSHGRTWWTILPWGWGLSEMGPREDNNRNDPASDTDKRNPLPTERNNPEIEPICKEYAELRYRLLSYNYTLAWEARETGLPLMRAMWLHYPDDEHALGVGDQYLWGRDLLIAPVYEPNATVRVVYLPLGKWYDWFTNDLIEGGKDFSRNVDLRTMPIFVRAGSIIPFDPVRQYVDQKVEDNLTLKIYSGANGDYTMYEDDGITNDYLKGENYRLTHFLWEDSARKLIIESGNKESGTTGRIFKVIILPEGKTGEITFNGTNGEFSF